MFFRTGRDTFYRSTLAANLGARCAVAVSVPPGSCAISPRGKARAAEEPAQCREGSKILSVSVAGERGAVFRLRSFLGAKGGMAVMEIRLTHQDTLREK